jgi:two-component system chemotaxis sensor kinase CheA
MTCCAAPRRPQRGSAILKAINEACRRVHAIKGDAATLGLDTLAAQAHSL